MVISNLVDNLCTNNLYISNKTVFSCHIYVVALLIIVLIKACVFLSIFKSPNLLCITFWGYQLCYLYHVQEAIHSSSWLILHCPNKSLFKPSSNVIFHLITQCSCCSVANYRHSDYRVKVSQVRQVPSEYLSNDS